MTDDIDTTDEDMAVTTRVSGDLYSLFLEKLPDYVKINSRYKYLDVEKIAVDLGLTRQSVYMWFSREKLQPNRAIPLTELPGSELAVDDLLPFVLKD
jgi:hypothetical protein